jgi:hypothetical protein
MNKKNIIIVLILLFIFTIGFLIISNHYPKTELKKISLEDCTASGYNKEKRLVDFSEQESHIRDYDNGSFESLVYLKEVGKFIYSTTDYIFEKDDQCYLFKLVNKYVDCSKVYSDQADIAMHCAPSIYYDLTTSANKAISFVQEFIEDE